MRIQLPAVLVPLALYSLGVFGEMPTDSEIALIAQRCAEGSQHSWEVGTRALAILTLSRSPYSSFHNSRLPPPPDSPPSSISDVFTIARDTATSLSNPGSPQALREDASAADPTSIGTAILIANWTHQTGADYAGAARGQLGFLFSGQVPKTREGALSHKREKVQLWSDFISMVPPFLAYYGVLTGNQSLVEEAYYQIRVYRDYLHDGRTGLWRHVVLGGSGEDPGLWASGNGWATMGMLRVLSIIQRSPWEKDMKGQQQNLKGWTHEILKGVYWGGNLNETTALVTNYLPPSAQNNFQDAAATALFAASAYRLSTLAGWHDFTSYAEKSRRSIFARGPPGSATTSTTPASPTSTTSSNPLLHFENGWLTPVVDPLSVGREGRESPEAQAFVMEMWGAYLDWTDKGSKASAAPPALCGRATRWEVAVFVWGVTAAVAAVM